MIRVGTARALQRLSLAPCLLAQASLPASCNYMQVSTLRSPAPPCDHAENGLSVLRHFPLLEDLSLRGCQQLQDGCLAHLAGLTRLARLDMRACEHLRGVVSTAGAGCKANVLLYGCRCRN